MEKMIHVINSWYSYMDFIFIFIVVGDLFLAVKWLFCHGKRNCLNTQCPIRSKCSQAGKTEEEKAIMLARIKQLLAELEQQNM